MGEGAKEISARAVEQVDPDNPDSLGAVIDRIQGSRVFSGHPADTEGSPESQDENEVEHTSQEPLSEAEEPAKEPPDQAPPEKAEEGQTEDWGFTPKYKSHREAEIGYREAERKMHEATQAAAALKAEVEQLRRELEGIKRGESQPSAEESQEPKTNEQLVAAYEAALTEISELDPYDPNYHKLAAKAWAKTGLDKLLLQSVLNEIDKRLEERLSRASGQVAPSPPAADTPPATPAPSGDEHQRLVAMAEDMARQAGLEMTPGSLDHRLFWSNLNFLPEGLSFQDEVKWMIQETKRLKPQPSQTRPSPESIHREHAVMERGSDASTKSPASDKPTTIGALLDKQMQRRVI
jgi:hypothetical protein